MQLEQLLVKGFDALQYVTNPYALFGFVFLIGIVAIGLLVKRQGAKALLLVVFAILALGAAYMLLDTTLASIEKQLLVHLVRDSNRALVAHGVEVQLADIETLKGKKDWEFNAKLDDAERVFAEVFTRAGVTDANTPVFAQMSSNQWKAFLTDLEEANNVEAELRAEKIKDIPFAKFRVFVDGVEDPGFVHKYYFKNETLCIPSGTADCARAKLEIVNLYNTKHHSSGEPEAANVRVLQR